MTPTARMGAARGTFTTVAKITVTKAIVTVAAMEAILAAAGAAGCSTMASFALWSLQ